MKISTNRSQRCKTVAAMQTYNRTKLQVFRNKSDLFHEVDNMFLEIIYFLFLIK